MFFGSRIAAMLALTTMVATGTIGRASVGIVAIEGTEGGMGFSFCHGGPCTILAPYHLLHDEEAEAGNAEEFQVVSENARLSVATLGRFSNAFDKKLDLMILEETEKKLSGSEEYFDTLQKIFEIHPSQIYDKPDRVVPVLDDPVLLFRERSGALQYVPVRILADSPRGEFAVKPFRDEECRIQSGRSGSLLLSRERRILGMLLQSDNCVGKVIKVERINEFLEKYVSLMMPSHIYSKQFITAARCTDEQTFQRFLSDGADPNAYGDGGHSALERIVTTYGIGLGCRNQGRRLKDREEFGSQEAYDQYIERERDSICRDTTARRLRMMAELHQRPDFRPDSRGAQNWTPLMSAVSSRSRKCSNDPIAEKLLEYEADENHLSISGEYSRRPLELAIDKGTTEAVRLLLNAGADPNLRDDNGLNAAMLIAVHPEPHRSGDQPPSRGCLKDDWETGVDTHLTKKLELIVKDGLIDLAARVPENGGGLYGREFPGLTVKEIILKRLDCRAANDECYAVKRTSVGRCLERMLSKLP